MATIVRGHMHCWKIGAKNMGSHSIAAMENHASREGYKQKEIEC